MCCYVTFECTNKTGEHGDALILENCEVNKDRSENEHNIHSSCQKLWSPDSVEDSLPPCVTAQTVTLILSVKMLLHQYPREDPPPPPAPFTSSWQIKLFQIWKERQILTCPIRNRDNWLVCLSERQKGGERHIHHTAAATESKAHIARRAR